MSEDATRIKVYASLVNNIGKFISGECLSKELGLSRTAVWKAITALRERGYVINSTPGFGYSLTSSPSDLTEEAVALRAKGLRSERIHYFKEVPSTNDVAKEMARKGVCHGEVIVADFQTLGRGRLSRRWACPPGKGLLISFIFRPEFLPLALGARLTGAVAVGVVNAIHFITGLAPLVKWPNDIFVSGKKVAGILAEVSAEMDRISYAVVGIGLNVNLDAQDLMGELADTATSLKLQTGEPVDRCDLLTRIVEEVDETYRLLNDGKWEHLLQEIKIRSMLLGKEVVALYPDGTKLCGIAEDIQEDGSLMVKSDQGLIKVTAGDVSLRTKEQANCAKHVI
jgi:BirA family biotin operon repressor/biotin-[acetyl-CoA-carboxylase] ligase